MIDYLATSKPGSIPQAPDPGSVPPYTTRPQRIALYRSPTPDVRLAYPFGKARIRSRRTQDQIRGHASLDTSPISVSSMVQRRKPQFTRRSQPHVNGYMLLSVMSHT